jgi:hypothetical protein
MTNTKSCLQCGKQFTYYGSQKVCGDECRRLRLRAYEAARGSYRGDARAASYIRSDNINPDYWKNIDEDFKAWLLGLIATDGCIHNNRVIISLNDSTELQEISDKIGLGNKLHHSSTKKTVELSLSCNEWVIDLASYGIGERKSTNVRWADIPFQDHYVRGLWDGNGTIGAVDGTLVASVCTASPYLRDGLVAYLRKNNCDPRVSDNRTAYDTAYWVVRLRSQDGAKLLSHLYSGGFCLRRKHSKLKQILLNNKSYDDYSWLLS